MELIKLDSPPDDNGSMGKILERSMRRHQEMAELKLFEARQQQEKNREEQYRREAIEANTKNQREREASPQSAPAPKLQTICGKISRLGSSIVVNALGDFIDPEDCRVVFRLFFSMVCGALIGVLLPWIFVRWILASRPQSAKDAFRRLVLLVLIAGIALFAVLIDWGLTAWLACGIVAGGIFGVADGIRGKGYCATFLKNAFPYERRFPVSSFRIIVRAFHQWSVNQDSRFGAAMAYYTLFSITPLLLLSITVAGLFVGEERAREEVYANLGKNIGAESAEAIKTMIEQSLRPQDTSWGTAIGLAVLTAGSLGLFVNVRGALCVIWRLEPPHGNTVIAILIDYVLALIMVLVTGVLLLASLVVSTVLPLVMNLVDEIIPGDHMQWRLVEMGVSLVLLTLLFAAIYRVLSNNRIAWRFVWYGSMAAAFLFTVGKTLMGFYLNYFSPESVYGAAGSVMAFLLWVYYSSLILFLGAELIQARRTRHDWLLAKSA